MTVTTADVLQLLAGDRLPVFRTTSNHLSAAFPFQSESGIIDPRTGRKVLGLPMGYCGKERSGGIFFWDLVQLYQAGLIRNTNVKILGEIGERKSSGVKEEIYLGVPCGYNHMVTDRKGEYTPLANAITGSKILRFGPKANIFINPLDEVMDRTTQYDLVASMALIALSSTRPDLDIVQKSLLEIAIDDAHLEPKGEVAVLPDVVERLFYPTPRMVEAMQKPLATVQEMGYELALALQRLTTGHLRGMFHEETTPGLFDETPLLVLNCEGLQGESAAIMIMLINFFTQGLWGGDNPTSRFHKIFHDEAWDLAKYPGFVDSLRGSFKLGSKKGVSNYIVAHHLSNLYRSGRDETIRDLIADSATTILYRQDEAELRRSAEELSLNEAEIQHIIKQRPGHALYKIGDLPGIPVEIVIWPEVRPLVETRPLFSGTPLKELREQLETA